MPTIAAPPPQQPPAIVFHLDDWEHVGERAHGSDARLLFQRGMEALTHWANRAETLVSATNTDDGLSYNHVPLRATFSVKTRYKLVGRIKPRTFPLDE